MNRKFYYKNQLPIVCLLQNQPQAIAMIKGSEKYSDICGIVKFYQICNGVIVYAEINNLPKENATCDDMIFGFHIHSGTSCTGNEKDPFANALTHDNPDNCKHPYHAGDFPPLFGNEGKAFSIFLTNRFCVNEIIGKTIIIHDSPDDFHTQPSGNSGNKIACGVINKFCK
ncbi:MAG: superoxide dismutase family protein [Oscillospiraceae bacterium]|nr:superoxide dismutase family protein [Oscillospiraceae bacterium]